LDLEDSLNLETVSADGKDLTEEQRATKEAEIVQTLRLFKNSVAHYKTFFPEIEQCKKEIVEKLDKDKDDLFEAYDEDEDGVREDKLRARLLPAITKYVKERADLSAAAGRRKKSDKKVDELDEKKVPKAKDPKTLGPKVFDKKTHSENFANYIMEKEPIGEQMEKKKIKKTIDIQKNKQFFVHTLLNSLLVPGWLYFLFW